MQVNNMTDCVSTLPPLTEQQFDNIRSAKRVASVHQSLMGSIPAMHMLEVNGSSKHQALAKQFNIAAWNLERCLFPEESAALLHDHHVSVALLSEVDNGMARTGQRHTVADMARQLGMYYVYGIEFVELGLGGQRERRYCVDTQNKLGWHGNAILSSVPFLNVKLARLDHEGYWFASGANSAGSDDEPRLGGRMAILATLETGTQPLCVVSTHLESNADPAYRAQQFNRLLDAIDQFAPGMPVIVGGDMNTGNHMPENKDWRDETLFALASARGYESGLSTEGMTTRPSLLTPQPKPMRLDWFFARDIHGVALPIVEPSSERGTPLSDHACMMCTVGLTTKSESELFFENSA